MEADEHRRARLCGAVEVDHDAVLAQELPQVAVGGGGIVEDVGDDDGVVLGRAVLAGNQRALVEGLALVAGGCKPGTCIRLALDCRLAALDAHGAHRNIGGASGGAVQAQALFLGQLLAVEVVRVVHQGVVGPGEHILARAAADDVVAHHTGGCTASLYELLLEGVHLQGDGGARSGGLCRCWHRCRCSLAAALLVRLLLRVAAGRAPEGRRIRHRILIRGIPVLARVLGVLAERPVEGAESVLLCRSGGCNGLHLLAAAAAI